MGRPLVRGRWLKPRGVARSLLEFQAGTTSQRRPQDVQTLRGDPVTGTHISLGPCSQKVHMEGESR